MAAGAGAIAIAVAKWAAGIGATVIATDLLNDYYQKNKGKIGETFDKWIDGIKDGIKDRFGPPTGIGKDLATIIGKPTTESTTATTRIDKEQTNGLQGSYDYSSFYNWLNSAEGQKFLNETAPRLRAEGLAGGNIEINPGKQEQIDSIQGNYDAGTYEDSYKSDLAAINRLTAKPGMFDFTEDETVGEILPNPGETNDDKDKEEFDNPYEPDQGITDKTDENLGTNTIDWLSWAEEEQAKRWEREDAIRKETQEREDTAYQRAVADMQKAGINPNLVGVSPAQSGGGITQASGMNLSGLTTQMNIDLDKMQQMIDNAFKGDENNKDRFIDMLSTMISMVGLIAALKK